MITVGGYVRIRVGKGHPLADCNGYAYEHQVVWCAAGHALPPSGWLLHHRNEWKTDNRLENLQRKRKGPHASEHNRARPRRRGRGGRFVRWARP